MGCNKILGILLLTSLFFLGCKSKKKLQLATHPGLSEKQIVSIFNNRPDFDFFDAKAKIKIKTESSSDKAVLYLRAKPDSILWIAGKRLSVEGGRLQIDATTATFINRLDKTYQIIPLDTLHSSYGITGELSYIQDLFMGRVPEVDKEDMWEVRRDSLHWTIKSTAQNVLHAFHLDPQTGDMIGGEFRSNYGYDGQWTYSDYREVGDCCRLPYMRKYEMKISDDSYLSVELNFSYNTLDEPKRIKFDIPTHYTRIN